jgi:uncharacterized membrane protein HdeD (DUF308 family)
MGDTDMTEQLGDAGKELLEGVKQNSGLVIMLGVILLIFGTLAIFSPLVAGLSIAITVGVLLILGGISQLFFAFKAGSFGKGIWLFILGALTVIIGIAMISQPQAALATLTLFLAAYFIVEGIFEIIGAFQVKPIKGWGWTLFSGILSLILGIMIWSQFPLSGAWAIGVLVGIKLIFSGWMLIAFGSAAKGVAKDVEAAV